MSPAQPRPPRPSSRRRPPDVYDFSRVGHRDTLDRIERELAKRLAEVARELGADSASLPAISLGPTRDPAHGDFASAAPLAAAKAWKRNPLDIARGVIGRGVDGLSDVAELHMAGPGFINVYMAPAFWHAVVCDVLSLGADFGRSQALAQVGPINVEFVSANPTGPVAVVQGRSGSLGSTLVELFRFAGAATTAETYVNDAGAQVDLLADSVYARYATLCGVETPVPPDGYHGEYLIDIARELLERVGPRWLNADPEQRRLALGTYAKDVIVAAQREDLERFRVHFDVWTSERALHDAGKIDGALKHLVDLGETYEKDGATWLRSTAFGDDKDRVLRRSDGRPTYLAADVAYHHDKFDRGARHLIDVLGPDHHGYIKRLEAIAAALGHPGCLEVVIVQQVTLKRGDELVPMSKRAGTIVTLRELIDEVGADAGRFFFVERAPESHLVFDLRLAVEQSSKNPVYYVQYGHARISSILRRAADTGRASELERARGGLDVARLAHPAEIALIRRMADLSRTVVDAAKARAPHRVAEYARSVATDFHAFYTDCPVLGPDAELASARLSLCLAAQTVLATALRLLGVTAPDKM